MKASNSEVNFYDGYHKQNEDHKGTINKKNFTYINTIQLIEKAVLNKKPKYILDYGCGVGSISKFLSEQTGAYIDGVDISKRALAIARKNSRTNIKYIHTNNFSLNENKYDLIVCFEVLEHIENDNMLVNKLVNSLKVGGLLLVSVPSKNAPLYKLGVLKKFDKRVGHLRRYTADSLKQLLEDSGLEVTHLREQEGVLRNSLYTIPFLGVFVRFIRGPIVNIVSSLDHISLKIFGESDIGAIAEKKHE